MRFSKTSIAALQPSGKSQEIYWDDLLPGFGLRLNPGGTKSWLVRYRINGERHIDVIGPYPVLTPEEARARAREILLNALDNNEPDNRRGARYSFERFADLYIERHARPRKRSWKEDERRLRLYVLPTWGKRPIASIKRSDVAQLHAEIGTTKPIQANRVRELLSKMFELAKVWGVLEETAPNPAKGIDDFEEFSREEWFNPEQIQIFLESLDKEDSHQLKCLFRLYLLTACRKQELLKLKWVDVDFDRNEIRIGQRRESRTKSGRSHYLPMSDQTRQILLALPKKCQWVFPGKDISQPLCNIDKAWRRICKRAGLVGFHIHDLRRTGGTYLSTNGHSMPVVGKVLNQSTQQATAVYARFNDTHLRAAVNDLGQLMGSLMGLI